MNEFHCLSMHAKYEVSISYGSKVMAKVKIFARDRHKHRQTGQQLDAPIPLQGHKKGIIMI